MKVEKKLFENAPLTSSNATDLSSYFAIYDKEYSIDQGKTVYHIVLGTTGSESVEEALVEALNEMEQYGDEGAYYINWFKDAACGTTIIGDTKIIIKKPYPMSTFGIWAFYPASEE